MKIERTKNASRNMAFGGVLVIFQTVIPFLMRTAMIYFMGLQYLGLSSLFTSVLQVLNIAELGVGNAMVYSMYKAIADDDKKMISALMRLYRIYYYIIGAVVAGIGLVLLPFIPRLVSGDIPAGINIYILYLLNLGTTVLSYWLFSYKNCLLQAHQRVDVSSKVTFTTSIVQYGAQLLVLILLRNYYIYVMVALATQAMTNIVIAMVVSKIYPDYKPIGKLDKCIIKGINRRVKDLFLIKVGTVIVNSVDTLVISAFLGLTVLALYQNYFYLITAIISMFAIVYNACIAGIGNSLITETKEKNLSDFNTITFIIEWLLCVCTTCFLCLFQPFIELWVGEKCLLDFSVVICLCVYFYIYEINQVLCLYKDAGGIWYKDKYRSWVTSFANLGMNLLLVNYWGLYGVVLSTVLSIAIIGMPWLLHNLFTLVFDRKNMKGYIYKLVQYTSITILSAVSAYFICSSIRLPLWVGIGIKFIICAIVPNIIFVAVYCKSPEMKRGLQLVNRLTGSRLRILNRLDQ